MKKLIAIHVFILLFLYSHAQERNLLENSINVSELSKILQANPSLIPEYNSQNLSNNLSPDVRKEIIRRGEQALEFDWRIVPASAYLEFTKSGNRKVMEDPQNNREKMLEHLALAELVENKGRFISALIDGSWAICEQSTWVLSAHLPLQKMGAGLPDPNDIVIDLTSARIGALLSWVHHYFATNFDKENKLIAERIRYEIRNRILSPYYNRTDLWWMGFRGGMVNNWNVWVNYNVLQCILLMEDNPEIRAKNIYKTMQSVDKFINSYPEDGGCDEGPSYWGHAGGMLFLYLELLNHTTIGKVNLFENPLIQNIGRYIYRAYIADPYVVNFADATAKADIYPGLVYRYGKAIHDPIMQNFGTFYAKRYNWENKIPEGTFETTIKDLYDTKEILSGTAAEPLIDHCWLPQSEYVIARDKKGTTEGMFFAAKGGHNDASHNHNDVGSFILYCNGSPALIDAGVGTYTRQTFSKERYSIWTMQSGYHNLPVINGIDQKYGRKYQSSDVQFKNTVKSVEFSLNIAGAYPEEAAVKLWKRAYKLNRGKSFLITDEYILNENKGKTALHYLTVCTVKEVQKGTLLLNGTNFTLELKYNPDILNFEIDEIKVEDIRLQKSWGDNLKRIRLVYKDTKLQGKNTITISQK